MANTGKYVGKWKMVSVTVFGMTGELSTDNEVLINSDGTASVSSEAETKEYEWTETSYGLYLDGKSDLKLYADGDRLAIRLLGVISVNLERQA